MRKPAKHYIDLINKTAAEERKRSNSEEVGCCALLADENKKMRERVKILDEVFWNTGTDKLSEVVMNFLEDWEREFTS